MNERPALSPRTSSPVQPAEAARPHRGIQIGIGVGVALVFVLGGALVWHAEARTNKVALASRPKPVTTERAVGTMYQATRVYVGTIRPWVEANVGPQFVSAYVDTVLVRPGAVVTRGSVLATLDCRNANASSQAIASQARAIGARQQALAHEATRTQGLLDGGFVSPNEAEQKNAQSAAQAAELSAEQATLAKSSLDVNDCVLRAPFDGEVSGRTIDPGAFVRPGTSIVRVVDRSTIRMTGDAPEIDFAVVAPGTKINLHVLATNIDLSAVITRRAPSADPGTRTIHFEIDVPDPDRKIPVDTTGEVRIGVGQPVPATEIPIAAVTSNGSKGTLILVEGGIAHSRTFVTIGEKGGNFYFRPGDVPANAEFVTEGRSLLSEGDHVAAHPGPAQTPNGSSAIVTPDHPGTESAEKEKAR